MAESNYGPIGTAVELTEEQLATLKKLETETKENSPDEAFTMLSSFRNVTNIYLYSGEQYFWSDTQGTQLIPLPAGYGSLDRHTGTLPVGAKYARTYLTAQDELPTTYKFIIAVNSPARKVYAEIRTMGDVDWNVIEVRLDMSAPTTQVEAYGYRIQAAVFANGNALVSISRIPPGIPL